MNQLKINAIESNILSENEQSKIKGSGWEGGCGCGCQYEDQGGSSTLDNAAANDALGINPSIDTVQTLPEVVVTP